MKKLENTILKELKKDKKYKIKSRKFATLPQRYTYDRHPATTQLKYNPATKKSEYYYPDISFAKNPEIASIEKAYRSKDIQKLLKHVAPELTEKAAVKEIEKAIKEHDKSAVLDELYVYLGVVEDAAYNKLERSQRAEHTMMDNSRRYPSYRDASTNVSKKEIEKAILEAANEIPPEKVQEALSEIAEQHEEEKSDFLDLPIFPKYKNDIDSAVYKKLDKYMPYFRPGAKKYSGSIGQKKEEIYNDIKNEFGMSVSRSKEILNDKLRDLGYKKEKK